MHKKTPHNIMLTGMEGQNGGNETHPFSPALKVFHVIRSEENMFRGERRLWFLIKLSKFCYHDDLSHLPQRPSLKRLLGMQVQLPSLLIGLKYHLLLTPH